MNEVTLTLGELGQRFERARGTVVIEGRRLAFSHLKFSDVGGRADVSGDLTLHRLEPLSFDADIDLTAKRLPIRRSGVLTGYLDGKVNADIGVTPERVEILIKLRKARLELSDSLTKEVQSLEENEDIVFSDGTQLEEQDEPTALRLRIDAREPFWIRRSDFSALVSTDIRIESRGNDQPTQVVGQIEVQRGVVELLGQTFDIERGTIELTGGHTIDPTLHLTASRRVPGSGGSVVRIEAEGPARAPTLSFFIDGQSVTAGDALAAALGTRAAPSSDENVEQQVTSVATGIAGSMLMLGVRRELGGFMPVLAVERNAGETRVRAGVEAGQLIPSFMKPLVVDAYVEGIVSRQEQTESGQVTETAQAEPAVLLELRFPYDLAMEAQYGPGERWSLDLGWEP